MTIPDLLYPKALAAKAPHLPDAVDVDLVVTRLAVRVERARKLDLARVAILELGEQRVSMTRAH